MTRNVCLIALLTTAGVTATSRADDLFPAPWRGGPATTVQHWDFSAGPGGGAPDATPLLNPYGSPMLSPGSTAIFVPTFAGRTNVWDLSQNGVLNFDVPNTGNAAHMKNLWLQVTFFGLAPSTGPGITVGGTTGLFTLVGAPVNTSLPGGWTHQRTLWTVPVCPNAERVTIFPTLVGAQMAIDQVVIDTQCIIPAPGAASAMGLMGLCAVRRRRPATA